MGRHPAALAPERHIMLTEYFENLLFDTDLDLSLCEVARDDPSKFVVGSKIGAPRIAIALLFGIPCLILIGHALSDGGIYLVLAPIFCPPLAILCVLFGFAMQQKAFTPSQHNAVKSYRVFRRRREIVTELPGAGVVLTYKRLSGGRYFYYAKVDGVHGFGFCIAKDAKKRDEFARDLAGFLKYEIRDLDEQ